MFPHLIYSLTEGLPQKYLESAFFQLFHSTLRAPLFIFIVQMVSSHMKQNCLFTNSAGFLNTAELEMTHKLLW